MLIVFPETVRTELTAARLCRKGFHPTAKLISGEVAPPDDRGIGEDLLALVNLFAMARSHFFSKCGKQ